MNCSKEIQKYLVKYIVTLYWTHFLNLKSLTGFTHLPFLWVAMVLLIVVIAETSYLAVPTLLTLQLTTVQKEIPGEDTLGPSINILTEHLNTSHCQPEETCYNPKELVIQSFHHKLQPYLYFFPIRIIKINGLWTAFMHINNPKIVSIILEFFNITLFPFHTLSKYFDSLCPYTTFATSEHPSLKIPMEFSCGSSVWFTWIECFEILIHTFLNSMLPSCRFLSFIFPLNILHFLTAKNCSRK